MPLKSPVLPLSRHPSTIDHKHFARDVIACWRSKEHGRASNILGFSPTRGGDSFKDLAVASFILLQGRCIVGAEVAWSDRVHLHIASGPFIGKRLGELGDAALGCSISRNTNSALK